MTRIKKFQASFAEFMAQFEPTIEKWDLNKNSPKNTGSSHLFTLIIPIHYSEEVPIHEEGEMVMNQINKVQERPTPEVFREKFRAYFDPYTTRSWNSVKINENIEIDDDQRLIARIMLHMANGENLPFPSPNNDEARFNRILSQNRHMLHRIQGFEREARNLRLYYRERIMMEQDSKRRVRARMERERKKYRDMLANKNSHLIKKLKEYYAKEQCLENCPICFEEIQPDKLYIPGCCHYLCEPCSSRVIEHTNKCPICREELYTATEENEQQPGRENAPLRQPINEAEIEAQMREQNILMDMLDVIDQPLENIINDANIPR